MTEKSTDSNSTRIREVINSLQSTILDLQTLVALLCGPLDSLGVLPTQHGRFNTSPLPPDGLNISRHLPLLQRALLEHVIPTWVTTLEDNNFSLLVTQYFHPDASLHASATAAEIALHAYSTILSLSLTTYSIQLLVRLSKEYTIDRLYAAIFSTRLSSPKGLVTWEDCLRNVFAIPSKVANALNGGENIPSELWAVTYFNNISLSAMHLIFSLSRPPSQEDISPITMLLTKLINNGVFPATQSGSPSQPSFFQTTLPIIRARFKAESMKRVPWNEILRSLPSLLTQQAILTSLLSSISGLTTASLLSRAPRDRILVKREATFLRQLVGPLQQDGDVWNSVLAIIATRDLNEGYARILVCWCSDPLSQETNFQALEALLNKILELWTTPEHVKHSLLARHRYISAMLLLLVSYFPPSAPQILDVAVSSSFISGVSLYIGHMDNSVRRCGMLVAECVARRAGKSLDFGDWMGESDEKLWARNMRELLPQRDVDIDMEDAEVSPGTQDISSSTMEKPAECLSPKETAIPPAVARRSLPDIQNKGYDSDDSLTGYASQPSSRSVSPAPSELEEIEKDPTLRVGVENVQRPVYLAQLGEMIRGPGGLKSGEENKQVDKLEVALDCAEELIRRKRNYGTELEENAVNLVYGFVGLQDNYELDNFSVKRQQALIALVACCPRVAPQCIIEQFFKNQYSTEQRYAMLNALALGARELASLPLPGDASVVSNPVPFFPSKMLPPSLHRRYTGSAEADSALLQQLVDGMTRQAIEKDKETSADKVPEFVRERQLRIRKPARIAEVSPASVSLNSTRDERPPLPTTFAEVAAEYFVTPLINRFWLFLRDEQTREERTSHRNALHRYYGAGTGLILNAVVISHFLNTLAIMVHAAQNAAQWLALLAPDALELAITLGTRPISRATQEELDDGSQDDEVKKEASVLTAALELAVIVLDGCVELDGGRSLGLEHTALLLGAGEWAGQVFSRLEKGQRIQGGGGAHEMKLSRAAAGVIIKVDELTSKWGRSMVDVR